jgi:predicted metal-dependent peptidase
VSGGPATGRSVALDGRAFAAARLWAVAQMPYLASALFAAPGVAAPGSGTIAADRRWCVRIDPDVMALLPTEELGRLLLHLVSHLVRGHAERAVASAGDDPERWNRAADAEINDDLDGLGLVPAVAPDLPGSFGLPPGGLAEQYVVRAGDGRPWDCGSGCDGRSRPGEDDDRLGLDPRQASLLCLALAAEIQRAGRRPGSVPAGWMRWAETVLPSRVDWRRVLAAEVRGQLAAVAGAVDYTYRRPSRRGAATDPVVLPSLHRPVPSVAIVCDTSGSMHERLLGRVLVEVDGILARVGVRDARVLAVDTTVHAVRRVSSARQVELAGGGGTDMGSGIAAASTLRPRPSIVVVLTDGFTPWPDRPPRGARVVVGLLAQHGPPPSWPPPWARAVLIDE